MSRGNDGKIHHLKPKEDSKTSRAGLTRQGTAKSPEDPSNNPFSQDGKPRAQPRETVTRKRGEQQKLEEAVDRTGQELTKQLSLPPGSEPTESPAEGKPNTDIIKLTEALATGNTEGDLTSLATTLKDFLPKLLQVDSENKKLKETVAHLEEQLARTGTTPGRSHGTKAGGGNSSSHDEKTHGKGDDVLRLEEEYMKMRRQLKRALDANQGWNDYCNDQLKVHMKQLEAKDEQTAQLREKLKSLEAIKDNRDDLQRQLRESQDELAEYKTEADFLQGKNHKLEEEQRQVRKLAKGLMKEKDDLQRVVDTLKEEITSMRCVSRVSESSEDITSLESNGAKTSSDSGTALSYPLRNVETVMNVEKITNANKNRSNRGAGEPSAVKDRGKETESSDQYMTTPSDDAGEIITFLQAQVQQYREDFVKERQDRERAVGELDRARKELEDTKLLLHQLRETQHKKKTKKGLFGGKQKAEKPIPQQAASFRFVGPDEVSQLQREREQQRNNGQGNQYQEEDYGDPTNHVYHEIDD